MASNDVKRPSCPICQGTGFANGEICACITGKNTGNLPDIFSDIFGDIFRDKKSGSPAESTEK